MSDSVSRSDIRDILDGVVFDYQSDGPQLMSEHLTDVMNTALQDGIHGGTVYYDTLREARARQFRDDPAFRSRIHEVFKSAGVTTLAPTLVSVQHEDPLGWEAIQTDLRRWEIYLHAADWMSKATQPSDLRDEGVNILLATQNATALEGRIDRVNQLHDSGIRIMQLTYNRRNRLGDGCYERTDAGLSDFGIDVVKRLNDLNVIVDVSHCGPSTSFDAIHYSDAPICCTHTVCKSINDHPRAISDELLERIGETNGYVGIASLPQFLKRTEDMDALVDHIEHAAKFVGFDQVGIGTDWGSKAPEVPEPLREPIREMQSEGIWNMGEDSSEHSIFGEGLPPMTSYDQWHEIPRALLKRGHSADKVRGICGENFFNYYSRVSS